MHSTSVRINVATHEEIKRLAAELHTKVVNNVSPAARALGVEALKPEKSDSITLGLGVAPDSNTSMTLDSYNIKMKDRVVLGNEIKPTGVAGEPLDRVLAGLGIVSVSFFTNALDNIR